MTCTEHDRLYRLAVAVLSVIDHPINSCTIKSAMLAIQREETAISNNECMCDPRRTGYDEPEADWDFSTI